MDGDVGGYRQQASSELLSMLPDDEADMVEGMQYQRDEFPIEVAVMDTEIVDDKATLNLLGRKGIRNYEGSVIMLLEDGEWKVHSQSWSSASEN